MSLPRVVVAAPATGQGKTTVSIGLMAALSRAGHVVSGHKVGPDYIDPGYHALACGRPGRNLDPHLVGEERIVPLLLHGARGADVAVIEGVMGLFDGRIGGTGFASTAHVATLTRSPVVLVVDISRSSRSIGAVVHGMATWDPRVRVAGVILNRAGSPRHAREVADAVDLPVLGTIGRDPELGVPSRHLGLVPAAERDEAGHAIDRIADRIAELVDLDAVLDLARSAPELDAEPWDPAVALRDSGFSRLASSHLSTSAGASRASTAGRAPTWGGFETGASAPSSITVGGASASRASTAGGPPTRGGFETGASAPSSTTVGTSTGGGPVVAVAGGRAFTFRYAETEELLRAAGCAVVSFDPLVDPRLPDGTAGIYLGGGFPEVHARELTDNVVLRRELAAALADGVPTVAECAGLLYLCRSLDSSPMVGAIPAEAVMTERLTLRYPTMTATTDNLLNRAGETLTGHEFHRTQVLPMTAGRAAWTVDGVDVGFASDSLHASYLHTHWAGHPQLAGRFAAAVHARAATRA
ncbi:cobyrinate a,c-diamide synthase [Nocardioides sp. LMS-CY]|nr:cobyrinate a,c-diamide synthase [Nocardioides sp. LMS-CY]